MSMNPEKARAARIARRRGCFLRVDDYLSIKRAEEFRRAFANRLPFRQLKPGEVLTEGRSHDLGEKPNVTLLSDFARGLRSLPGRGRRY